jgi:hypothetical protein
MVAPSSPDFHVHDGDTEEFGQFHEDRILGERGGVVVRVRVEVFFVFDIAQKYISLSTEMLTSKKRREGFGPVFFIMLF